MNKNHVKTVIILAIIGLSLYGSMALGNTIGSNTYKDNIKIWNDKNKEVYISGTITELDHTIDDNKDTYWIIIENKKINLYDIYGPLNNFDKGLLNDLYMKLEVNDNITFYKNDRTVINGDEWNKLRDPRPTIERKNIMWTFSVILIMGLIIDPILGSIVCLIINKIDTKARIRSLNKIWCMCSCGHKRRKKDIYCSKCGKSKNETKK